MRGFPEDFPEILRARPRPKTLEAAIEFIAQGGEECIVTSTEQVAKAVAGNGGTHLIASWGHRSLAFPLPQP